MGLFKKCLKLRTSLFLSYKTKCQYSQHAFGFLPVFFAFYNAESVNTQIL